MKKGMALLIALLMLPCVALADELENCSIASGIVAAQRHVDVLAPCSGTLDTFDLVPGDRVTQGDTLFALRTTAIYAPEDGTVSAVFTSEGGDAASACARYGCVMSIEPDKLLIAEAATNSDVTEKANLLVHVGQQVYLTANGNRNRTGEGRIIQVDNTNYVIEMDDAEDFDIGNTLAVYLKDDYQTKNYLGRGILKRREDAMIRAEGRIVRMHVAPGDHVNAGQLLMEVLSPDAAPNVSATITAPESGVISAVAVSPGQQVWKGALLARIDLTDHLEVVASVDEMDLNKLRVGDTVTVTLDMDESNQMKGTVTEIGQLGETRANAAYFAVHVSVPSGDLLLGASASVYIPQ